MERMRSGAAARTRAVRAASGFSTSTGSRPLKRASSATLGNQTFSPGESGCVATSAMDSPRSSRNRRHSCPVSEYAKTARRVTPKASSPHLDGPRDLRVRGVRAETVDPPHAEAGPAAHLLVDATDVLPDDP